MVGSKQDDQERIVRHTGQLLVQLSVSSEECLRIAFGALHGSEHSFQFRDIRLRRVLGSQARNLYLQNGTYVVQVVDGDIATL